MLVFANGGGGTPYLPRRDRRIAGCRVAVREGESNDAGREWQATATRPGARATARGVGEDSTSGR